MNRRVVIVMTAAIVAAVGLFVVLGGLLPGSGAVAVASRGPVAIVTAGATPTGSASAAQATPSPVPTPTPLPTPSPTPTPIPTPTPVPAPLTGRLVAPAAAERHPIAVMIDDLGAARPQSGFSAASVVWQAPAEGGIPRYMLIFQERIPTDVGPVRSARYYFIAWAAEWNALYVHSGGSPQALSTLRAKGSGQLVYNADEFRWGGSFHRITTRNSPHNLYTSGKKLRRLLTNVGAKDGPMTAAWKFAPEAPLDARPKGGVITVKYPYNTITYHYDRTTNTYLRTVTGEAKQTDAASGLRVAPKNVVVMLMSFAPLNDNPLKHRLEAEIIGTGKAWIATNGHTTVGTWKKTAIDAPTRFYDVNGTQIVFTVGQTFVQVMPLGSPITIKDGSLPTETPATSPSPAP